MITEREHNAWLRVQQDAGWRYGETYSEAAKTDPKMVPYAHLAMEDGAAIDVVAEQPVEETAVVEEPVEITTVEDLAVGDVSRDDLPTQEETNG